MTPDNISTLLLEASSKALQDLVPLFGAVFVKEDDGIKSFVGTLARLRTLEMFLLKSAAETLYMNTPDLLQIKNDVKKTCMLMQLSGSFLSVKEVVRFYPGTLSEEELTAALQKIETGYTKDELGHAINTLRDALIGRGMDV